jgi:hypothetical protein
MPHPKAVILRKSVHEGSTAKGARAMAAALEAAVVAPEEFSLTSLDGVELVGPGAGVSYGRMHEALFDWVQRLPERRVPSAERYLWAAVGLLNRVGAPPLPGRQT